MRKPKRKITKKLKKFRWVWQGMKQRCLNPRHVGYHNYGGRGICCSEEWKDFENFYNDMYKSYKQGLTLERVDNDGDYCKENCCWASRKEQSRNNRRNVFVEYKGKKVKLIELSDRYGIPCEKIWQRVFSYKIPVEDAIKTKLVNRRFAKHVFCCVLCTESHKTTNKHQKVCEGCKKEYKRLYDIEYRKKLKQM